jgi:Hpt domain
MWTLTELRVSVDPDIIDLVPAFLGARELDASAIEGHLIAGTYAPIVRIAHCMKGGGGSYGFPVISAIGLELERAAHSCDARRMADSLMRLRTYLASVKEALSAPPVQPAETK